MEQQPLLGGRGSQGPSTLAEDMGQMGKNTLELKQILEEVRTRKKLTSQQQQRLVFLREQTTMLDRRVRNGLNTGNSSDPKTRRLKSQYDGGNSSDPKTRRLKSQYDGLHKGFVEMTKLSERVEREFFHQIERNTNNPFDQPGNRGSQNWGGDMTQVQIMEEEDQQQQLQHQLQRQQLRQQQYQQRQEEEKWDLKEVTDLDARLVQELNRDISDAESELSVIVDLMNDLGVEVKTQGEKMEVIEDTLFEAEEETTMAIQELERAPCCATCWCCQCCRSLFFCCKC